MSISNDKPILALDCATPTASVALAVNGTIHTRAVPMGKQAALLVPTLDALLREHGVEYAALGAIITSTGPGSFTGLRIGLAVVHGLALAHQTPVKTLTSLLAVACDVEAENFHVGLNAGKGEVFVQAFTRSGTMPVACGEIQLVKPEALEALSPCYSNVVAVDSPYYVPGPRAETLCRIAPQLAVTPLAEALPLYIRPPDAKTQAPPPWLQTA